MAKKVRKVKTSKKRSVAKKTKKSASAKKKASKPRRLTALEQKVLQRYAELNVDGNAIADEFLDIQTELDKKSGNIGEMAWRYDAAMKAFHKELFVSDDPAKWIAAARKAAKI
jgi:hypothetical protein